MNTIYLYVFKFAKMIYNLKRMEYHCLVYSNLDELLARFRHKEPNQQSNNRFTFHGRFNHANTSNLFQS